MKLYEFVQGYQKTMRKLQNEAEQHNRTDQSFPVTMIDLVDLETNAADIYTRMMFYRF